MIEEYGGKAYRQSQMIVLNDTQYKSTMNIIFNTTDLLVGGFTPNHVIRNKK